MKDCVSLEIAKKLKEAGWKQDDLDHYCMYAQTHFSPCKGKKPWECKCVISLICDAESCDYDGGCAHDRENAVAAPTIGELLEALPQKVKVKEGQWSILHLQRNTPSNWEAFYNFAHIGRQNNPADALALLWMALKEKGMV